MQSDETYTPEFYEEAEMDCIEAHIERHFGASNSIFHAIVPPDIHVDIVVIPPRKKHNYYTLVTMGMGAHVMDVPEEMRDVGLTRAELLINLPPDWRIGEGEGGWDVAGGDEGEAEERYYWPVRCLKTLARMPGAQETWLGWGHSIPTGGPLPGTNFSCLLLLDPDGFQQDVHTSEMPDDSTVTFYQVVPLYEDETEEEERGDFGLRMSLFSGLYNYELINR